MKYFLLSVIVIFCLCTSFSQEAASLPMSRELAQAKNLQHAQPFFIQIAVYSSPKKYFPKLYPIGYILKDTDQQKKITKYLLGDFANEKEAIVALEKVKGIGYKDAFVVNLTN